MSSVTSIFDLPQRSRGHALIRVSSTKHVPHHVFTSKSPRELCLVNPEGEPEAALGSPEVGRVLHTIDADLVCLQ